MSDVFLKAFHGGLGDSLQFSTLPEEFAKQQGRKTYIVPDAPFRNPEIYDLVWGKNPYVLGKKEGKWNAGDIPEIPYSNILGNTISNWEKFHGLKPVNKYPKIYYEPEKHEDIKDVFIVDFSSISIDYDKEQLNRIFNEVKKEFPDKKFLSVSFQNTLSNDKHNVYDLGFDGYIEIENIFRYCDLISSAYGILALSSGASHLSAALMEYSPNLKSICVMPKPWYNKHKDRGMFLFDTVEYLIY